MRSLLYQHLKKKKAAFFMTSLVLAVLFVAIPAALAALESADETVELEIHDFARGSYDLLIRPPHAGSDLEDAKGVVEENYLGTGDGGITVADWEDILVRSDIEIAAPVAALGHFTPSQLSFNLPTIEEPVRYTVSFSTTDGIHDYVFQEDIAYSLPHDEAILDHGKDVLFTENQLNAFHGHNHGFYIPQYYHPFVAIDPQQETQLTGMDLMPLEEEEASHPNIQDTTPMGFMGVSEAELPFEMELTIDRLAIENEQISQLLSEGRDKIGIPHDREFQSYLDEPLYMEFFESLDDIDTDEREAYEYELSDYLSIMNEQDFFMDDDYELVFVDDYDEATHGDVGQFMFRGWVQNTYYQISELDYQIQEDNVAIQQLDEYDNGIPIYREILEVHQVEEGYEEEEDQSSFVNVGEVSVTEHENELAASPLGIYSFEETTLDGEALSPTALPGDFLPLPAHGVTSIEWAEELKGEEPIDAIRVKVADIDGYTVESAEKIEAVADDIEAAGFQVDVIAGASHQDLEMTVEGFGTVEQPVTTLGAADTILRSWNMITIMVTSLFTLIGILTFWNRIRLWLYGQRADEKKLSLLGWDSGKAAGFFRQELSFLLVSAVVFSGLLAAALMYAGLWSATTALFYAGALLFGGVCAAVVFKLRHKVTRKRKAVNAAHSLTRKNLRYYASQLFVVFLQVMMASILSAYVFTSFLLTEERTTMTRLGEYVHVQTEPLQMIILTLAFVLTGITLVEALRSLWRERADEIRLLHVVGWSRLKISRFLLKEVGYWAGLAVVTGFIASIAMFYWTMGIEGTVFSWSLLFSAGWFVLILLVSWWTIVSCIRQYTYST